MRLSKPTTIWLVINVVLTLLPFWIWDADTAWWLAFFWATLFACLAILSWTVWGAITFLQSLD